MVLFGLVKYFSSPMVVVLQISDKIQGLQFYSILKVMVQSHWLYQIPPKTMNTNYDELWSKLILKSKI